MDAPEAPHINDETREIRLLFRALMLDAISNARQAHVRPGSVNGGLFGDDPETRERLMVSGVQVIVLADFNAALDAVFGTDDGVEPEPRRAVRS